MIGDLGHQYYQELGRHIDYAQAERLDMEPFCALASMLRNLDYTDRRRDLRGVIGGAPQLLKVYPFFRTLEFGVHWPDSESGKLFLNGREVFDFEKIQLPALDAGTLDVRYPLEGLAHASELTPPLEDTELAERNSPEPSSSLQ
jgi:hypothetical protein